MKTMNSNKNISKAVAFLFAATFAVSFTACNDDIVADNDQIKENTEAQGELLEAYGLTYQDFENANDVIILNADTTEISVSKGLADKLGIKSFVNHPLGIWHQIEQLPYARKATTEKLVGDRYILTVEPATLAELIGDKEVRLNTDLYVNNNVKEGAVTRAGGVNMPDYAAKYVDDDQVIHPAVIHMTDPLGYDTGYHNPDEQPLKNLKAIGSYNYITPEKMAATRASAHRRILGYNGVVKVNKKFACGSESEDTVNFDLKVPIDFELNYFITLNGGVKWKVCVPVPYVKKFEAGLDGKFAFAPEMTIGFKKEWKLDRDKWKYTLVNFDGYTFTFWVGCVPVVIKCRPQLYARLDGKVNGQAVIGFKYDYENNFKSGVRYENGDGWSIIKEFNEVKNDFTFIRPQVRVHAEAGIGLYLGMDVMIYDVAGPTVSVGPRLGAEADLKVSPLEKEWNEKTCFTANVALSVNAEAGAKLKVLGYDLGEWIVTFKLAGPWILWKYPSDGTEHKVGDLEYTSEDYQNYNILMNGFLKSTEGYSYSAFMRDAISELMEMYDIDNATANKILQKNNMKALIKTWGYIPTGAAFYHGIYDLFMNCVGEVHRTYYDYLEQKAGESGDTEYLAAKNWEHIMELLSSNNEVKVFMNKYTRGDEKVHTWFIEDFGREPSESPEDLEWLVDHMVNFEQYWAERFDNKDTTEEVYQEGWDAVKAKLQSLYPEIYAEYPKPCNGALNYAKNWFQDYYPGVKPSTNPYYFDQINEKFCEYLRNQKGIAIEQRS
jgi:hypothetical protein